MLGIVLTKYISFTALYGVGYIRIAPNIFVILGIYCQQ